MGKTYRHIPHWTKRKRGFDDDYPTDGQYHKRSGNPRPRPKQRDRWVRGFDKHHSYHDHESFGNRNVKDFD